jgi:outer membrane protein
MRTRLLLALWGHLIAAGTLPAHALAAPVTPVDLRQAIAAALSQNPDLDATRSQIQQAEAAVRQAEGNKMPRINLSLTGSRSDDPLNAFGMKLGQRHVTFGDFDASQYIGPSSVNVEPSTLNNPGAVNNFNTRIELLMPIYNAGQIQNHVDTAKAYVRAAQSGDAVARQHLIKQVLMAYQGVHTARAYITLAADANKAAQEFVRVSDRLHQQGMVLKSDVLSARANLQEMKIKVIEAKNAEAAALDQLALMMSRPLHEALDVGAPVIPKLLPGTTAELRAQALAKHAGINALRNQIDGAGHQVKAARAERMPKFNVMARQDWNDKQIGLDAASYTVAGVLSWTAFDGGITRAAIDRAEAARSELAAKLRQAEAGVAYQVGEAQRKALEADEKIVAREAGVAQAIEAQRLIQKRYENSMATAVEVLAAQAQSDKARADLVAAHYDAAVQRAELQRVVGVLSVDTL